VLSFVNLLQVVGLLLHMKSRPVHLIERMIKYDMCGMYVIS